MYRGYVKLWRKLEDSFFYRDSQAVHLWVYLLFEANHKATDFLFNGKKAICGRGQIITGRNTISNDTGINRSKIERLLDCFESEHLIEQQKNNKFRLISILKYEQYQSNDGASEQQNEQLVSIQRATNEQQLSTNKNVNTLKRTNNNIDALEARLFETPTIQQVQEYSNSRGSPIEAERFVDFYQAKGWMIGKNKMKDWKAAARNWMRSKTLQPVTAEPRRIM